MAHKHNSGQSKRSARLLALLLALIMLCSVLFVPAYAAAVEEGTDLTPAPQSAAESGDPAPAPGAVLRYIFHVGETVYETKVLASGEALERPADPAEENKAFAGWFTAAGLEFTAFGPVHAEHDVEVSLYAHFTDTAPANEAPAEETPAQEPPQNRKTRPSRRRPRRQAPRIRAGRTRKTQA